MSPENLVGYGEQPKASAITKCFEDAYKSPMCVPLGFRRGGGVGGAYEGAAGVLRERAPKRDARSPLALALALPPQPSTPLPSKLTKP